MPRPPRSPRERPAAGPRLEQANDLFADLEAGYRDADGLYAGWSCPASTECCRFGITGREPYVTSIELAAVRRAIAARGGIRSWKRAPVVAVDPSGAATGCRN